MTMPMDPDAIRVDFEQRMQAELDRQPVVGDDVPFDGPKFCRLLRRRGIPAMSAVVDGAEIVVEYAIPRGVG